MKRVLIRVFSIFTLALMLVGCEGTDETGAVKVEDNNQKEVLVELNEHNMNLGTYIQITDERTFLLQRSTWNLRALMEEENKL